MTTGYIDLPSDVGGTVDLTTEVTGVLPIANGGTNSSTQNFVDLTTAQVIGGAKRLTSDLTLGTTSSVNGQIILNNAVNANTITVKPGTTSSSWTLTLPPNNGGSNSFLHNTAGNGLTTWSNIDLATTDVTGTLPVGKGGTGSATQNFVDLTTGQSVAGAKSFTDALNITQTSANSLTVGPTGATNPVFQIDSSTASQANGLKVTGTAAASGVNLAAISSNANEGMTLTTKGTGQLIIQVGGSAKYTATATQNGFTQAANAAAATPRFAVTGAADTSLTLSTEAPHTYFNIGQTRQHATGAIALQRDFRITPSIHSFVGASTITNSAAFSVDGPSNASTNATVTNSSAIYVPSATIANTINSYGINIAATSGATNNYAAYFSGGNVGVNIAAPVSLVHTFENNSATGNSNGFSIEQAGTGDAIQHFLLTGVQRYTMGIDNSDSDKFKIGTSADLGSSNLLTLTNAGLLGIGTNAPGTLIHTALTSSTAYTSTSASLAIPANVLATIENLDTTDATASLISFVSRSGASVNRTYIGNVSNNTSAGNFVIGQRTGTTSYAERFRIDSSGNVGIGTTTPSTTLDVNGAITSAGAMSAYYQSTSIFSGGFNVYKRGTTGDATASLTSGTELGYNAFHGWDGSAYGRGAFVLARTTEAWSGTGHGSSYSIWTTPTGSTTSAERMRIDQNGNVGIGAATPNANAILDVTSTTKAFMPPRMTTTQKNAIASPTAGMVVYDSTLAKLCIYTTAWETVTSS